jgi:tetratricopeptide (TPR) repeat protein
VKRKAAIRWSSPDAPAEACDVTPGLLGYRTVGGYRLVLDYAQGRVVLESPRKRRVFDANKAWLERDVARYGDDVSRAYDRVPVLATLGKMDEARQFLERALAKSPGDADLVVLAARLDRAEGKDAEALVRLSSLPPPVLADHGEWVGYLGALQVAGRAEEALTLAQKAVDAGAEDEQLRQELLVGLSDSLLAMHQPEAALKELDAAISVDSGGSGFLFRRALLALAIGDRYAAIATLRSLLDVYPIGGQPMWLYALTLKDEDRATFRADLDHALARLHPGTAPLDFVGASLLVAGDPELGKLRLSEGYERDCKPLGHGPDRDNCDAWYWALGGQRLEEASRRIDRAIRARPDNSAYRDTAAVVAWSRGDKETAAKQAKEAARLSPGDPYLIWQASRMTEAK